MLQQAHVTGNWSQIIPLIHMVSFARSGETLMLRCLNAHPRIEVVSQVMRYEDEPLKDDVLFHALQDYSDFALRRDHPLLLHRRVPENGVLIVKSGIWVHRWPSIDFVLARNPFAVVNSLRQYEIDNNESEQHRRNRLARWASKIDPSLISLCMNGDETEAIARLYAVKMMAPSSKRFGVVRYEDFVADPARSLQHVLDIIGVEWSDQVMRSHETYPVGKLGHGNIKLWEPVRVSPYKPEIDMPRRDFEIIASITQPALERYGYRAGNGRVDLL